MTEREKSQAKFWPGGPLASGLQVFPLTLARLDALQSVQGSGIPEDDLSRVALYLYTAPEEDLAAAGVDPAAFVSKALAAASGVPVADFVEFCAVFLGDCEAMAASQVESEKMLAGAGPRPASPPVS